MSAFITEITVKSAKKIPETYFKLNTDHTYISRVTQNDVIR